MTASSDTLRSSEPPSPAGPLCSLGWDPLVHTGRGLQSGLDSLEFTLSAHTLSYPILPCPPVSRLVTLTRSDCMELIIRGQCNWWETCSFCAVYNECSASALCMCLHQRRQLCTMEQRHCQSQMGVCGGGGLEGKGIRGGRGRSLCVLNVQGDAKIQCGTPKAKDKGWVGVCRIWENKNWGAQA